nr:retrovirus-related Pol polyprotein from transposon TNT 1-94 [Tanacetum cinerariifolium]
MGILLLRPQQDDPHKALKDKGIINSGCSRHMTGKKAHFVDYHEFKGGSVAFGGRNGRITGKGKIKAGRFSWVYFLKSKDETTPILKDIIRQAKIQFNHKVKTIRSDNGTKFKNHDLIEFCGLKGIKREYSNARTPQQNGVAKRKNRTLIEAARTMVLVTKPQNKTPYELLTGRQPIISYLRPFGCYVSILNTIDQLEKIDLHDEHFVLPIWSAYSTTIKSSRDKFKKNEKPVSQAEQIFQEKLEKLKRQEKEANDAVRNEATHDTQDASTNLLNAVSVPDIYASPSEGIFTDSSYDDEGVVTDFYNLETTMNTRSKVHKNYEAHALGSVDRNKARLVTQGHRQEEGIEYDEVFAHVARIEAIRIFLAFTTYMGFIVYQMDVKSTFLYGIIDEKVYVTQPPGFVDPKFPNMVYKVVKDLYGLHQAPRAWYATLSTLLERNGYRRGAIDKSLFIKQDKKDIMLVQVYMDDIIFCSTKKSWCDKFEKLMKNSVKITSTPNETQKPLVKDDEAVDVDLHLYRSMIGSLMYLTASRPDIIFAEIHKKRLSLSRRLISWQCKKQTIVATFNTEAEYVAAAHCCRQEQTTLGKDFSNSLMADNLPKIKCNEALAILEQTATSKEISNPLMADEGWYWFSEVMTPLFKNMLVPAGEEVGQAQDDVSIPTEPSTSKPHKKHKSKNQQPIAPNVPSPEHSPEHQIPSPSNDPIPDVAAKDSLKFQVLMDLCTRLSNKVSDLKSEVIDIKSSFTAKIEKLEDKDKKESFKQGRMIADMNEDVEVVTATAPTTTAAQVPKASAPRRRREQVKKSERQNNEVIRYQALKRKPLTEAQARKNMMIYLKNMAGFRMNFFKGMTYSEIRPIFEKHYNLIQAFLEKEEEVTVQENEIKEEGHKREEATPLASKVPIIDYQIHHENNKPYYKIIRADGTHKLFLSFITLLKNFNIKDSETLWKLVKERFESTKPKNFSNDFLLNILNIMFPMLKLMYGKIRRQMLDNFRLEFEEESEMSLELLREEMKEIKDGCNKCGGPHPSSDCDDKPMGGPKEEEANYASGGYRGNYYVEYLALDDLGASINLMSYSLYAALSGTTLKPTRMRIRLENHTYQYHMGVAENMLIQNKELNLGIREDRATFHINKAMQHSHVNDDTCFCMDVTDEITKDELDDLLDDSKPFLNTSKKISKTPLDKEFDEFILGNVQEDKVKDNFEELPSKNELRIKTSIQDPSTDLEMKPLPKHLKYAFMEENSLFPVVISSLLEQNKKE